MTKTQGCQCPLPRFAGIIGFGVTLRFTYFGILLAGSPQPAHMLAGWPYSPNCLPVSMPLATQLAFVLT